MKHIAAIILAVSLSAHAQEAPKAEELTPAQVIHKRCSTDGRIAKSIMSMRQMGMPMSTLMAGPLVQKSEYYSNMVIAAYNIPRYSSQAMQDRTVEDFINDVESACFSRK